MKNDTPIVIANPAAAGGKVRKNLHGIHQALSRKLSSYEIWETQAQGHATALAEKAVNEGYRTLLSLGGDGTHNEIVNGIMGTEWAKDVAFGVLPSGTGGDFKRLLTPGQALFEAIENIDLQSARPIDVGHVEYTNEQGEAEDRYFLNIASCGVAGLVDKIVNRGSKRLGGKVSFMLGTLEGLLRYTPPLLEVRVDGSVFAQGRMTNVLVCNGQYAGGGMRFAPNAKLSDQKVDVVAIEHRGLVTLARRMGGLYDGSYLQDEGVHHTQGTRVEIAVLDEYPAYLDVDGEAPGVAPANFRIVPHAIQLIGAKDEAY